MTVNGIMAIILHYFAEFGSFPGQLRKSGWLAINRFSPDECHNVHQLSTTDALCSSRYRSFLFTFGGSYVCANFGENRSRTATTRVPTDGYTDTTNRFLQGVGIAQPGTGCESVTFCCFVQTNEDTIVRSSASGRKIILVSGEVELIRVFPGGHPQRWR